MKAPRRASKPTNVNPRGVHLRVGFVSLIDAAPLVAARELGYFEAEGLSVQLERQPGWAAVRDKLTFGHLDASHAVLGMPLASQLGREWFAEPLVAVMALGSGGNAISVSSRLVAAGVNSAATLARYCQEHRHGRQPVFAHVFNYSSHHYLLRKWLAAAGINPDLDVQLVAIPPSQVNEHMSRDYLDGFCVGEPWNMMALKRGHGLVIAATVDIVPDHPEKVLATTARWAAAHPDVVRGMIRALLRGCAYCESPANYRHLAAVLAQPKYLGAPTDVIEASFAADRTFALGPRHKAARPADWQVRSFAVRHTFPAATHCGWMMEQMIRWGHLPPDTDVLTIAAQCVDTTAYRDAAAALGIPCPPDDFPPMPLRGGRVYELRPKGPAAAQRAGA